MGTWNWTYHQNNCGEADRSNEAAWQSSKQHQSCCLILAKQLVEVVVGDKMDLKRTLAQLKQKHPHLKGAIPLESNAPHLKYWTYKTSYKIKKLNDVQPQKLPKQ